jgi:dienelactone hydrolase
MTRQSREDPGHDTAVVVAHEIYGVNDHIEGVARRLRSFDCDVFTPGFLPSGVAQPREDEAAAYREFMRTTGVATMAKELTHFLEGLRPRYRKVFCVGFSVGATSAWLASGTGVLDGTVCFYGSRIRDHLEIRPTAPCLLVFAEHEPGFSAPEVAERLRGRMNVTIEVYPCHHGFCDPYSPNHSAAHGQRAWEAALRFLGLAG